MGGVFISDPPADSTGSGISVEAILFVRILPKTMMRFVSKITAKDMGGRNDMDCPRTSTTSIASTIVISPRGSIQRIFSRSDAPIPRHVHLQSWIDTHRAR